MLNNVKTYNELIINGTLNIMHFVGTFNTFLTFE